jgi:hypothetical protein
MTQFDQGLIRAECMTHQAILEDRLPLLLLNVAEQVDRKLGGKTLNFEVLEDFRTALSSATGVGENTLAPLFLTDPSTSKAFAQAVADSSDQTVSDVSELSAVVKGILGAIRVQGTELELTQLKRFCLSLHRSIMVQQLAPITDENRFNDELGFYR